jgi:hypothetical protein
MELKDNSKDDEDSLADLENISKEDEEDRDLFLRS